MGTDDGIEKLTIYYIAGGVAFGKRDIEFWKKILDIWHNVGFGDAAGSLIGGFIFVFNCVVGWIIAALADFVEGVFAVPSSVVGDD